MAFFLSAVILSLFSYVCQSCSICGVNGDYLEWERCIRVRLKRGERVEV